MMFRHLVSLLMLGTTLGILREALGHGVDERLGKLEVGVQSLMNRVSTLEQFHDESSGNRTVSFLVRLSSVITPRVGTIIKFPVVVQNYGNAYSPSTGKFTAPVSGTYLFHVSAVAQAVIKVDLVMDGHLLATAWGYRGSLDVQGSNMAVVHMYKGQAVWARFMHGKLRVTDSGFTQFTGTLLRKD